MAIYNNVPGDDEKVLKKFKEPAWNNPVVRFIDNSEKDLIPRWENDWSQVGLLKQMKAALEKAGRPVPLALKKALEQ
ncbi:MAG TPA: hypothetical protein PLN21_00730 [Gemmatales bacterium]|nr:hypothetical protein [Gemmatales bacterium]